MADFPRKFGKFILLKPLAQGGMGALYLAVSGDPGLEKLCCIKTVLPHLADAEYVQRFRDEAKVVVKLTHGNLVPVFDAGLVDAELYLAMEYIEGKDLRAVWNRCAQKGIAFPIDVAVHIVKEVCRGLDYAHSFQDLKLVHRDVSPPNVLCAYSGEVKLTDFGLASSTLKLEKTAPGVIYGKVSYMAPEQARGEPLDGRTDIYAAGILLWELLTGRQLFPQGKQSASDVLNVARSPQIDRPSKRTSRVPPALDAIALRALATDPAARYQRAEEMRAALAEFLAQEAPATDAARMSSFMRDLFAGDIEKENAERDAAFARLPELLREVDEARPSQRNLGTAGTTPGAGGEAPRSPLDTAAFIGAVLDNRYKIRSLIGEGGMGRVYEAEHAEIGKRVAVKILHPVYSRTPEVVERFRREARAASKIGHPNIVDVTDSGTTVDGSVYFVMEYLEGVELGDVIGQEGALPVPRSVEIAVQICRALAAAHAAGIVHRDLKPENIFLVTREGVSDFVKVLDFGIAKSAELEEKRVERLTHPGMAMGTPEYMAPEQAAGRPSDHRVDVYAAGAILYEMLTGAPPYDGENFMEILTKKATEPPAPPRLLRPDLPENIELIVMTALARDPDDRYPTMEAFEYELTKALAGRGAAVAKMLGLQTPDAKPETSPLLSQSARLRSRPTPSPEALAALMAQASGQRPALGAPGEGALGSGVSGPLDVALALEAPPARSRWRAVVVIAVLLALGGVGATVTFLVRASTVGAGAQDAAAIVITLPDAVAGPPAQVDAARPPPIVVRRDPALNPPEPKEPPPPREPPPSREPREPRRNLIVEGRRLLAAHRYAAARDVFTRARDSGYQRGAANTGLGQVAFQQGDFAGALKHAQKATTTGGGADAHLLLGNCYFRLGKFQDAIAEYRKVLAQRPGNAEARRNLEAAQKRLGQGKGG
jgi:serine/threonine protein kinase